MYNNYDDNYVLELIYEGNEEARNYLLKKYDPFIYSIAKKYINGCSGLGIDINDLVQEGRLALNNAIDSFNERRENLFYTFMKICVENKMLSILTKNKRLKYKVMNESVSLDNDEMVSQLNDILSDTSANPMNQLLETEDELQLINKIKRELTPFEEQVFMLKISHFNYKEIASILDKNSKSIDNTFQRIKNKVKKILN